MHEAGLIFTLTTGLSAALVCGYIARRLGFSPIIGYLLAGIAVGPHTPGVFIDANVAKQFAEIGIILLMFGVGMHFRLEDLLAVKSIAIPGAIGQSAAATLLGMIVSLMFGWNSAAGLVLGLAISVASTVVIVKVLETNKILHTKQGYVAVGWTVVEDIFTVFALMLLPIVHSVKTPMSSGIFSSLLPLVIALGKITAFAALMLLVGARVIPYLLVNVARLRSRELFTLSVLTLALAVAAGASLAFGTSIELGAFLAGLVVGQSKVSHQAASDALPMRDAFAVLFFVSVGMLFDPVFFIKNPGLIAMVFSIIVIGKPLAALLIILALRQPAKMAVTVAVAIGQIGEFSFILANLGNRLGILPDAGNSAIIACALISIAINPFLFKVVGPLENWLRKRRGFASNKDEVQATIPPDRQPRAIVVGYGPVGQAVARILKDFSVEFAVIELNIDTVGSLRAAGTTAVYGDASQRDILTAARIENAEYLLLTLPDLVTRIPIAVEAREVNPNIKIFSRAHYITERSMLEEVGIAAGCYEDAETAVALAELLLRDIGIHPDDVREETNHIREELAIRE